MVRIAAESERSKMAAAVILCQLTGSSGQKSFTSRDGQVGARRMCSNAIKYFREKIFNI